MSLLCLKYLLLVTKANSRSLRLTCACIVAARVEALPEDYPDLEKEDVHVALIYNNASQYYHEELLFLMIGSFTCKDTEGLYKGKRIARFSASEAVAIRKLAQLNVAGRIDDLRVPPGNRLEALSGKRKGQWSLRINDQWRVCLKFEGGNALDVEIVRL